MAEITREFEGQLKSITLVPSGGGRFEVDVDGDLVYSKLETGRHADEGEVVKLIKTH